jgi:hypothetical protein
MDVEGFEVGRLVQQGTELIARKVDKVSDVGDMIATNVDKVGGLLIPDGDGIASWIY